MSKRRNNGVVCDGIAWNQFFEISDTYADDVVSAFWVSSENKDGTPTHQLTLHVAGTGAVTLANYDNCPVGTTIIDLTGFTLNIMVSKSGTTGTWKSETLS